MLKYDGSVFVQGTLVTNTDGTAFKAKAVSYNSSFRCAIKSDATGTVWCWGYDSSGELGTGATSTGSNVTAPQQVSISTDLASNTPLTGITAISVADYGSSACAVGTAGAVWCWGYGASGQLGTGDMASSNYAVPVVDASSAADTVFKSVSVSYYDVCGLNTDNTVWCWGDNYNGEIGNGVDNMKTSTSPRYVVHPTQAAFPVNTVVTSVIANNYNYTNCASTDDGSAWCWGENNYGDLLGNTTYATSQNTPSQVLISAGATAAHQCREGDELVESGVCPQDRWHHLVLAGHGGDPGNLLRGAARRQLHQGCRRQRRRSLLLPRFERSGLDRRFELDLLPGHLPLT